MGDDERDFAEEEANRRLSDAGELNLAHAREGRCFDPDCEIHNPDVIEDDAERLTALAWFTAGAASAGGDDWPDPDDPDRGGRPIVDVYEGSYRPGNDAESHRIKAEADAAVARDLADDDLFRCERCGTIRDNDDSRRTESGELICADGCPAEDPHTIGTDEDVARAMTARNIEAATAQREERFQVHDFDRHGEDGVRYLPCVVDHWQVGADGERLIVGVYEDGDTADEVLNALVKVTGGNEMPQAEGVEVTIPYGLRREDLVLDSSSRGAVRTLSESLRILADEGVAQPDDVLAATVLLFRAGAGTLAQCLDTAIVWECG